MVGAIVRLGLVWAACDLDAVPTAEVTPTTERAAFLFPIERATATAAANRRHHATRLAGSPPTRAPHVRILTRTAGTRTAGSLSERFIRPAATRRVERARDRQFAERLECLRDPSCRTTFGRTRTPVLAAPPRGTATPEPALQTVKRIENGLVQIIHPDGASGSGFVVSPDGHVVAGSRAVGDRESITARFVDGTSYTGMVLARDETMKLAVIKVTSDREFQPIPPGNWSSVWVGDRLIAAGFLPANEARKDYAATTRYVASRRTLEPGHKLGAVKVIELRPAPNGGTADGRC